MCLFCKIINREEVGYFVYEDDNFVAFLDKFPAVPGHTLLVAKKHYDNILEIPNDYLSNLAKPLKIVSIGVMRALKADGIRILTNVGRSAGQVIFHTHIHLIPSWSLSYPPGYENFIARKEQPKEYYEKTARIIKEEIDNLLKLQLI